MSRRSQRGNGHVLGESPRSDFIVRDADGNVVDRRHVRWVSRIGLGIVRTRGLQIGDRVETRDGRVVLIATAETVR